MIYLLNNLKIGKVSSINPQACTAKVLFEDEQNLVSYDLPIIVPFTLGDKLYYMPKINERVVCMFLNNSRSQGFILGSFYAQNRLPPIQNENVSYIQYEDGTTIKYNKSTKELEVECVGLINIKTPMECLGNVNVKAPMECSEVVTMKAPVQFENGTTVTYDKASKTLDVDCKGVVNIKAVSVNIESDTNIKLKANNIDIEGNEKIEIKSKEIIFKGSKKIELDAPAIEGV